jgi:hypothetical protein
MKIENARKIVNYLNLMEFEARLNESYSGRCMYGAFTAGVTVQSVGHVEMAMQALNIDDYQRTDSMGRDTIVY